MNAGIKLPFLSQVKHSVWEFRVEGVSGEEKTKEKSGKVEVRTSLEVLKFKIQGTDTISIKKLITGVYSMAWKFKGSME